MAASKDFTILQGKTFSTVLRWESAPIIYKPITAATQTAPVSLTVTGHAIPPGWRAAVVDVKGMTELNAASNEVKDKDYHAVTVVDANTIQFNDINAAGFKAYTSGGYVQYNTPVDMASFTARLKVKDKVGGTELLSLTTENAGIVIDNAAKTITLVITATATAALTWTKGVYDLEMVSPGGTVTQLMYGKFAVSKEVTT